jgi:hypothetical protein
MKKTICVTLLLISSLSFSQSKKGDYLVTEEKDTIFCKIVGLSGKRVEYIKENENSSSTKNIYSFIDVNITDLSVIENPLGIKIEQPEKGFAYVYLYRPYVYTGSALNCKVDYNGTSLVNLKTKSYYLHKVKANEIHKYNWNNSSKIIVEINAKEGEVYFIRGSFGAEYINWDTNKMYPGMQNSSVINSNGKSFGTQNFPTWSNGMNIFIDNPKIARYMVLTMKKESPSN